MSEKRKILVVNVKTGEKKIEEKEIVLPGEEEKEKTTEGENSE